MSVRCSLLALALLSACSPGDIRVGEEDTDTPSDDTQPTDDTVETDVVETDIPDTDPPEPTYEEFDGATLQVYAPAPAGVYRLIDGIPFNGEVRDAGGQVLPFTDLRWTLREEPSVTLLGKTGNATVDAGIYTVDVVAALPNGDTLRATVGGVRVQSRLAGVYAGTILITASTEVQGTPIETTCIGGLDFEVDLAGEQMSGSGGCQLSIPLIGTIPFTYDIEGDIVDPDATGQVLIDIPLFQIPVDFTGRFGAQGGFDGRFAGDASLFEFVGTIDARKVSDYVSP